MAGVRKGWENLSPAIQRRYERQGVDRAAYESGAPLAGPRGHAGGESRGARYYDHDGEKGWKIGGPRLATKTHRAETNDEYFARVNAGKVRELNASDLRSIARHMPAEGRGVMAVWVVDYGVPPRYGWIGVRLERAEIERAADRVSKGDRTGHWTMAEAVHAMIQTLHQNPPQGIYGIAYKTAGIGVR